MATANPKTLDELEALKKSIKEAAAAKIAAIKKAASQRTAALKPGERQLRAKTIQDQKRRENHAKILVGIAMIHQCQTSEISATNFKNMLETFYGDSGERLKAALFGLTLPVKKPVSDAEQD